MSQELQLRPSDALPDLADPLSGYDARAESTESIFTKIHRLLRGRYHWAIVLAILLGSAGAYFGFKGTQPVYISTGMIHIKPVLDVIMWRTSENGPMPMYESFVHSQAAHIKSQRVIDMALEHPEWRKLGRDMTSEQDFAEYLRSLSVTANPRSEIIVVSFQDRNQTAAQTAVKALLHAYHNLHVTPEGQSGETKRVTLDGELNKLKLDLRQTRSAINGILKDLPYGPDGLRTLHQNKVNELAQLESSLTTIRLNLVQLTAPQVAQPDLEAQPLPDRSAEDIAVVDPVIRQMLNTRDEIQSEIAIRYRNLGEKHHQLVEANLRLAKAQERIDEYVELWNRRAAVPGAAANPMIGDDLASQIRAQKARQQEVQLLLEATRNQVMTLAEKVGRIDELKKEEAAIEESIKRAEDRLDQLRIEQQGRVRIGEVDRPRVEKDKRLQLAGLAGVGGGMLGFAIVMAIGLLDRRLRTPEDARSSASRLALLGVLPSLPEDLSDPEQAAIAAHCVHQIRTLLQIGAPGPEAKVFAITSPAAGTGKTSLTLSLGVSFAAGNARTLLIDCDLIGGGLTGRVDAIIRRKIGQIFRREGLVNQQQLETAMRMAHSSQRKLGEILVELGYLTEEDVARALVMQKEMPIGMLDAMAGEDLEECIAETGIHGLHILPLGAAMPNDVSKLSPSVIRRIIQQARTRFDAILIDTGPVPGSLEASVVAAAADGVVLVVSRGEHRPLAERSIQHLQDIGAHVVGMVFNRAEGRDVELASATRRFSSFDRSGIRPPGAEIIDGGDARFGPVALAVANRGSASRSGK